MVDRNKIIGGKRSSRLDINLPNPQDKFVKEVLELKRNWRLFCLNGGELKQYCTTKKCVASEYCQHYRVNVAIINLKNKLKNIIMENAGHLFDAYFEDFEKELELK
jgi:hypothetical protein